MPRHMETKECCGAARPSKSLKGIRWNPECLSESHSTINKYVSALSGTYFMRDVVFYCLVRPIRLDSLHPRNKLVKHGLRHIRGRSHDSAELLGELLGELLRGPRATISGEVPRTR